VDGERTGRPRAVRRAARLTPREHAGDGGRRERAAEHKGCPPQRLAPVDPALRVVRGLRHGGVARPPSSIGGCKTCASVRRERRMTVRIGILGGGNISDTHARAARETLGVIVQDRAARHLQWLKQLVAAGALGKPILVSARVKWYRPPEYYARSEWRGTWALDGGGALMNQGIHSIDLLLWLLGDVERVYATARTALHAIEAEDTAVACLEFAGGAIGTFDVATSAFPGFPRRVEL